MNLILKAAAFARQAHDGQRRKYNDRPYIQHPARVAGRVAARPQATEAMVAAAFLHDVVEDTLHTLDEILAEFSPEVARLVAELTNPSKGSKAPRREREQLDRDHLAVVSVEAKVIKLLDRIDTTMDAVPEKALIALGRKAGPLGSIGKQVAHHRIVVKRPSEHLAGRWDVCFREGDQFGVAAHGAALVSPQRP